MSAELDKSLDQIMQSRPKNRRGASRRSSAPASTSARQRYAGAAPESKRGQVPASTAGGAPAQSIAQKIMVSGLPPDVNEEQIKELFQSTVGALSSVQLNFDSQGRSKGTATVIFQKKGDANKAFSQYNNRLIDGKRPMKIEIVMDPTKVPPPPLASRVAPAPEAKQPAAAKATAGGDAKPKTGKPGRAGRGRRRKNNSERPAKSAADLDAEMEVYKATPDEATA